MNHTAYTFVEGTSPLIATAIHDGHHTRDSLQEIFNLNDSERLREEDPFTAKWLNFTDNRIIVHHSRFEADINRPRAKAVYVNPEDVWGLKVWKEAPTKEMLSASISVYDGFYERAKEYFDSLFRLHDKLVVFDIHSYNHRREAENKQADVDKNPEVNLGTQNMNRQKWQPTVNALLESFQSFDYDGRHLDVRENVKFKGGYFGQWLYQQYGDKIAPISIEFKKFFMDEWTGKPFEKDISLISKLMESSKLPVMGELKKLNF